MQRWIPCSKGYGGVKIEDGGELYRCSYLGGDGKFHEDDFDTTNAISNALRTLNKVRTLVLGGGSTELPPKKAGPGDYWLPHLNELEHLVLAHEGLHTQKGCTRPNNFENLVSFPNLKTFELRACGFNNTLNVRQFVTSMISNGKDFYEQGRELCVLINYAAGNSGVVDHVRGTEAVIEKATKKTCPGVTFFVGRARATSNVITGGSEFAPLPLY